MLDISQIDFNKGDGLVPVIAQDDKTKVVLMLGYTNEDALQKTIETGKLTFYSRTKSRLWTKGEESGHFLNVVSLSLDCDNDTILAKVNPVGHVCHTGSDTCWDEVNQNHKLEFLNHLTSVITSRKLNADSEKSYVASLFSKGINKIAQKVGEEAIEVVIEAKDNNADLFLGEAADLLFHYMILLEAKGHSLNDVIEVLKSREK